MGHAFVKIAIYFSVPHVICLQTSAIFAKSHNLTRAKNAKITHNAAKSQNFARIKDAQITDKAVKYTDCRRECADWSTSLLLGNHKRQVFLHRGPLIILLFQNNFQILFRDVHYTELDRKELLQLQALEAKV